MRFLKIPKPLTLALIAAMFASFPLKMWREYGENAKRSKIGRLQARLAKLENDLAVSAIQKVDYHKAVACAIQKVDYHKAVAHLVPFLPEFYKEYAHWLRLYRLECDKEREIILRIGAVKNELGELSK